VPDAVEAKIKHKEKKGGSKPSSNGVGPPWPIMNRLPEKKSPAGRNLLKPEKAAGQRI
jgi:hypothetical protein